MNSLMKNVVDKEKYLDTVEDHVIYKNEYCKLLRFVFT